jgi:BirA family biotin operon repressor/biotin-[acetyl-CoA-carboxylase] ligase
VLGTGRDYQPLIEALAAQGWIQRLLVLGACPSTNPLAMDLAETDSPALVVTENQTEGRGRRGSAWRDLPGTSALMSVAWRPARLPADATGLVGIAGGVAAAEACRAMGATEAGIKWPNDIWIGDAKVGGVLVQSRVAGTVVDAIVVGIGLNVSAAPPASPDYPVSPTCLDDQADGATDPLAVIAEVMARLCPLLSADGAPRAVEIGRAFSALDVLAGRRLEIEGAQAGVGAGIDDQGQLLLRRDDGSVSTAPPEVRRVRPLPVSAP